MRNIRKWFVVTLISLTACQERLHLAPVTAGTSTEKRSYIVQKGDTLFSIAFEFDKNYKDLANINHLSGSSTLRIGQTLALVPDRAYAKNAHSVIKAKPIQHVLRNQLKQPRDIKKHTTKLAKRIHSSYQKQKVINWLWPAKGRIVQKFSPKKHQKGIDIQSKHSTAVYASRAGRVAYSGDGLRGYGNLIIIKHAGGYLSAYAHNKKNWVKEGQWVKAQQKIAEMGTKGRQHGVLHFEIRHRGKPLDPLKMLSRR